MAESNLHRRSRRVDTSINPQSAECPIEVGIRLDRALGDIQSVIFLFCTSYLLSTRFNLSLASWGLVMHYLIFFACRWSSWAGPFWIGRGAQPKKPGRIGEDELILTKCVVIIPPAVHSRHKSRLWWVLQSKVVMSVWPLFCICTLPSSHMRRSLHCVRVGPIGQLQLSYSAILRCESFRSVTYLWGWFIKPANWYGLIAWARRQNRAIND